jgi:hypothetical protein
MRETSDREWGVYHCPQRGPVKGRRWVLVGAAGSERGAWAVALDLMAMEEFSRGDWQVRPLAQGEAILPSDAAPAAAAR